MLEWIKTRAAAAHDEGKAEAHARKRHGCNKAGKYRWLYEYLETRYANTVVLTFGQVEDLLGFSLPDLARTRPGVVDDCRHRHCRRPLLRCMDTGQQNG